MSMGSSYRCVKWLFAIILNYHGRDSAVGSRLNLRRVGSRAM